MAFGDRKKKKYTDFVETVSGEIVYVGKHYVYNLDNPLPYRRFRGAIALSCTGSAILAACAGLYRAPGTDRTLYVVLPYVILLCFTALMCYRGGKVVKANNPMRAFDYHGSYEPMQHWAAASIAFGVILIGCYLFHLFRSGREGCSMAATVCFPLMAALICASDGWLFWLTKKNLWHEGEASSGEPEETL